MKVNELIIVNKMYYFQNRIGLRSFAILLDLFVASRVFIRSFVSKIGDFDSSLAPGFTFSMSTIALLFALVCIVERAWLAKQERLTSPGHLVSPFVSICP